MNKLFSKLLTSIVVVMSLLGVSSSEASLLFQSGDPVYTTAVYGLTDGSSLAGKFILDQSYEISGSELYMYTHASSSNQLFNILFYGDTVDSEIPDSTNLLGKFEAIGPSTTPSADDTTANWYGRTDLSLNLDAGTYWVGFEVDDSQGQDLSGLCPLLI